MADKCKSCGAAILWVVMESGRKMPLDAEPAQDGTIAVVGGHGRVMDAGNVSMQRRISKILGSEMMNVYRSHLAHCPGVVKHRKAKK